MDSSTLWITRVSMDSLDPDGQDYNLTWITIREQRTPGGSQGGKRGREAQRVM